MELFVLDKNFEAVYILDSYESVIWTDRYRGYGDFEIYTKASKDFLEKVPAGYYLYLADSDHLMIIEDTKIETDVELGSHFTISGRSLESILDRRIIWNQTTINGNLQNAIKTLINDSIINPTDTKRKISNFIFEDSTDTSITSLTIDKSQYTGNNLYDVVMDICEKKKLGFKIELKKVNNVNKFVFSLYLGKNRSYSQLDNPFVIFSPDFENIINSDYYENYSESRTVALVAGEGEGDQRKTAEVGDTEITGLDRKELYVDARDISSNDGSYTPDDYTEMLETRGKENLDERKVDKAFEGEVESTILFKYGEDFFLGDIVQLENEYGKQSTARVTEIIRSEGTDGYSIYPSFEIIEDEETEEAS